MGEKDQDWRPDPRTRTLMFVASVAGQNLELVQVGDPTTCAMIRANVPPEAMKGLIGRWVWIIGSWGDRVEIDLWVELPKEPGR